jgi:hypothetical protein
MATPNSGLPTVPNGQTNLSIAWNEAMQTIDALLPLVVQDKDLTVPPTTVVGDLGKRWIVAAAASGAWAGKTGQIALCVGPNLWAFINAPAYIRAYVIDETAEYRRGSTAVWTIVP